MQMLSMLKVSGFRSIRDMGDGLALRPVNVVIGANGCGKSNLVALFSMLKAASNEQLAAWTRQQGGAAGQLYYGPKCCHRVDVGLVLLVDEDECWYQLGLEITPPDQFYADTERVRTSGTIWTGLMERGGEPALALFASSNDGHWTAGAAAHIRALLGSISIHHFNDTTSTARVMGHLRLADNAALKSDGANLACVLHRLREQFPSHYQRILGVVRQVVPFFGDLVLDPVKGKGIRPFCSSGGNAAPIWCLVRINSPTVRCAS